MNVREQRTNTSNGTSTLHGEHLLYKIILKSMKIHVEVMACTSSIYDNFII